MYLVYRVHLVSLVHRRGRSVGTVGSIHRKHYLCSQSELRLPFTYISVLRYGNEIIPLITRNVKLKLKIDNVKRISVNTVENDTQNYIIIKGLI